VQVGEKRRVVAGQICVEHSISDDNGLGGPRIVWRSEDLARRSSRPAHRKHSADAGTVPQFQRPEGRGNGQRHHPRGRSVTNETPERVGRCSNPLLVGAGDSRAVHVIIFQGGGSGRGNRLGSPDGASDFRRDDIRMCLRDSYPEGLAADRRTPTGQSIRRQRAVGLIAPPPCVLVLALTYFVVDKF